jgi:hypothetical protein
LLTDFVCLLIYEFCSTSFSSTTNTTSLTHYASFSSTTNTISLTR